ncbi:MAG: DUF5309 domain-containing protein [Methanosarcinaceae archaeon]|nr:DUF5309 domain-containing protein [Methanosarcinaceae archaeon]
MATDSDTYNYRGVLYLYGKSKAPFLSAISGRSKRVSSWTFPLASPWTLGAGAQTVQSEDTAAAAGTIQTITRGQDTNVCQIMKYDVQTTFKKQSLANDFYAASADAVNSLDGGAVLDELGFQKKGGLMQLAKNIEKSFLDSTYVAAGTSATATATRGLSEAITTNTVAAGSKKLEKSMIEELVREMIDSGAPFDNVVMVANAFQMQQLSDIYGYAPMDRTMGGVAIDSFLVPGAGVIRVLFSPEMPAASVYLAELSVCAPVYVPVSYVADGNVEPQMQGGAVDVLFQPSTVVMGAARGGFLYTQIGLDYGPEEYHGSITGLATSA